MGSFYTNYHVRIDSSDAVSTVFPSLAPSRGYVSPPKDGWVTVYDEASDDQDDAIIRKVGMGFSRLMKTWVIAFLVHDSDIFHYWLFQNGELIDEFDSAPEYFGQRVSAATRSRLRGNSAALLPVCRPGTTPAQIDAVLHDPDAPSGMADDILSDLVELLGIDEARAMLGFRYFEEKGAETLEDADSFEPVGGAERVGFEEQADETEATDGGKVIRLFPAGSESAQPKVKSAGPELDAFGSAIGDLAQYWAVPEQWKRTFPHDVRSQFDDAEQIKQLRARFDRSAKTMLRRSKIAGRPGYEELKAARDKGPDALVEMLVRFAPEQVVNVAVGATANRIEPFIAALISCGLDPNARSSHGVTPLEIAELHAKGSRIHQLLKSAAEKRRI